MTDSPADDDRAAWTKAWREERDRSHPIRGNGKARVVDISDYFPGADMPEEPAGFRAEYDETRMGDAPGGQKQVIKPTPYVYRPPGQIPPREWIYASHYIRKYVTGTIANAGVGKSKNAVAESLAMSSGLGVLGPVPVKPLRVWYWNGEDPAVEIERQIAGTLKHHSIRPEDLGERFFYDSGRTLPIKIGLANGKGFYIAQPLVEALIAALTEYQIDVLIVDPFVSCHSVAENDNPAIDAITKEWARVAEVTNCSIELVHHVRKTGGADITAEDGRGASSFSGTLRSVRTINVMSSEDAERAQIEEKRRRFYFRLDRDKVNLSPPGEASWFHLASVDLENGTDLYPEGDSVGVVEPFTWPDCLDGYSVHDLRSVQAEIAKGEYRADQRSQDWVGHLVGRMLSFDTSDKFGKAKAGQIVARWTKNGALKTEMRHHGRQGREVPFVIVGEWA